MLVFMPFFARIITPLLISLMWFPALAERGDAISIAFYNTQNLFDYIPSREGRDAEFTPEGVMRWNKERYYAKLENIAVVIEELDADLVGLCEIENRRVIEDIDAMLSEKWSYIHHESNDKRGMDLALFYKTDLFAIHTTDLLSMGRGREALHMNGTIRKGRHTERLDLLLCHLPSYMNHPIVRRRALRSLRELCDSLHLNGRHDRLVVMGDMNTNPHEPTFRHAFGRHDRNGFLTSGLHAPQLAHDRWQGTLPFGERWSSTDMIMTFPKEEGTTMRRYEFEIFVREHLLRPADMRAGNSSHLNGMTFDSRTKDNTETGFSDHLPVILNYIP